MFKLHIFTVGDTYSFHHTVNLDFDDKEKIMLACVDVLSNMHNLFEIELDVVTMDNKQVTINNAELGGVMVTSIGLPYSCYAEGVKLDSEQPLMYDPSMPEHTRVSKVIEC